jgi:hypothetical protein
MGQDMEEEEYEIKCIHSSFAAIYGEETNLDYLQED